MAKKKYKSIHSKKKRKSVAKGSRANKKLITILIVAAIICGGALAGMFYMNFKSASRNIAIADAYMVEGKFRKAYKSYGRAASKEPSNLGHLQKLQDALLHITPMTQEEASAFYDSYITTLLHGARYSPSNINMHLAVADEMYKTARKSGNVNYWKRLKSVAKNGLDQIALDDPRRHELVLYLGISSLRIEDAMLTETYDSEGNVRFPGEDELELVLESDPGNAVAWAALAHGRMALHYRLSAEGKTKQSKVNRLLADETLKRAHEVAPDSFDVAITYFREMLLQRGQLKQKRFADPASVTQEQIDAAELAVVEAQSALVSIFDPTEYAERIREIVSLLLNATEEGPAIAITLLQKHVSLYPKDYSRRFLFASVLSNEQLLDEARAEALIIVEAPQQTVGFESIEQFIKRVPAALMLVELPVQQAIASEEEIERAEYIEEAKSNREILADFVSHEKTNLALLYADGIIAIAELDYSVAAKKLEEVVSRMPAPTALQLRYVAIALGETGAKGLAAIRLKEAIDIEPGNLANYLMKARLEMQMNNSFAAQQTLSLLPKTAREVEEVAELLDFLVMRDSVSQDTVFTDATLAAIASAERVFMLGESQKAVDMLLETIEATDPPNWRLYAAVSKLYMDMGETDSAIENQKVAIELNPDSKQLKNRLIAMQNDGRVETVIGIVQAGNLTEAEQAEKIALDLFAMGIEQGNISARWRKAGDEEESVKAAETSTKAFEYSKKYQLIAEGLGVDLSKITVLKFNQAMIDKDIVKAHELAKLYESMSSDFMELAGINVSLHLFSAAEAQSIGDLVLQKMECRKALEFATSMTKEMPFSALGWRALGIVHTAMGNEKDALLANEEAYRIAPKSKENIRSYVGSLLVSGKDSSRILRVIRLAHEQYPSDKQIIEVWLDVESLYGSMSEVLSFRKKQYLLRPNDRKNAIRLAEFYSNIEPEASLLRHPDGTRVISSRAWDKMVVKEQEAALARAKKQWDVWSGEILEGLAVEVDPVLTICLLHADVLRDRGRLSEASAVWDRFIESRKGTEEYTVSVIAAAEFFRRADRISQSISLLKSASAKQSDQFEIDAALGSMYYIKGEFEKAASYLEKPVAASGHLGLQSRRIESLAMSGQFDAAKKALSSFSTTNNKYASVMLKATINRQISSSLLARGDIKQAVVALAEYRQALYTAIEADPKNLTPYFLLCKSLLNEYRLTQDKDLLEEALILADEGARKGEKLEQFATVRADVLQADGQLERAADLLATYLVDNPASDRVRQRLIEAYLDLDNTRRAIASAQEGIDFDPSSGFWYQRLGDLYLRANDDRGETAKVYLEAIQRNPSVRLLRQINELTRTDQKLPDEALLAMSQGEIAALHPVSASIQAKALANLGKRQKALQVMEQSWNRYTNAIARGWISPGEIAIWFLDLRELFKNNPEAGEKFALGLALNTFNADHYYGLAGYYKAFGIAHITKVVKLLDTGVALPDIDAATRLKLLNLKGGSLVEAGLFDESRFVFKKLLDEQNNLVVRNNYAYVVGVYMNKPAEGLAIVQEAVKMAPRNPFVIDTVSMLHERLGQFSKAAEMLDYLLVIDPSNAKAMARLAILYSDQLGQPERGIVFAERARSLSPRMPEVLDALGWSYYQAGRKEKAKEYLQRSLKLGETMNAYVHLSQLLTDEGQLEKALDNLRIAQELAEDTYSMNSIKALQDDIRSTQNN